MVGQDGIDLEAQSIPELRQDDWAEAGLLFELRY
jgi:hypothetical protein